jgi:exopolysaccharide biosynthesis WecB/TagA/CpsF family protein
MVHVANQRCPHILLAGVPVAIADEAGLVEMMVSDCRARRAGTLEHPVTVLDCNGQALSMARHDHRFAECLGQASIVHADGQFIVWASRLRSGPSVPERTATTDLIHAAATAGASGGLKFFLLGAEETVNRRCAQKLGQMYPGLGIDRRDGFFSDDEVDSVIDEINASGCDVLWVGMGKPREQDFAIRYRDRLNCAWIVTCGGCFNFVTGDYTRAPAWMRRAGLEWVHRMATGPGYLLPRYLYTVPHAIGLVLTGVVMGHGRLARGKQHD